MLNKDEVLINIRKNTRTKLRKLCKAWKISYDRIIDNMMYDWEVKHGFR